MSILIRLAQPEDAERLIAFDHVAQADAHRRAFIQRTIAEQTCWAAMAGDDVVGYGVLVYTFFANGFVDLLYVHPAQRRTGVGAALMRHFEAICRTEKLFTSTNLSNLPMQALLNRLGYTLSGVIHNLDEGDPEIVYFKRVRLG